ncbi:restriction endonuclease subunit S [Flavobacteriales bacterium]|nr:restriction endonuclease subunit S [Flavobacteriales bacterium]
MREGWDKQKLEDVLTKDSSNLSINKLKEDEGIFPFFGAKGLIKNISFYHQEKEYLAIIKDGAGVGRVSIHPAKSSVVGTLQYLIPKEGYDTKFLYYYLLSIDFKKYFTGSTIPHIYFKDYKSEFCPKVSNTEQKEIVSILDDAFASIDKAKGNIERNIENAKELFQSKLNEIFSQTGESWEEKRFKDVCVLQRGFDLPKRLREKGKYDLVTSSGIKDSHVDYKVEGPGVVTGRSGSIGNVFYIHNNFWPLNTSLYIKDFKENNERYIYYFLKSFDLSRFSSGSGVPTLNRNFVHDELVVSTINIQEQKEIVTILDKLNELTQSSISNYEKELESLEELKKSILQKAFSGELTNKSVAA